MQYLLLLTNAPDAWDAPDVDPADGVIDDWVTYTRALEDAGVLVTGAGLHGPETATSVRVRGGERLLVDGPFAETKEHIVGVYLIEAAGLDDALDWAAKVPNVRTGTVEVRPVQPQLTPEATLAGTRPDGRPPAA